MLMKSICNHSRYELCNIYEQQVRTESFFILCLATSDAEAKAPPNREHQLNTAESIWEYLRSIAAARDENLYRQKAEAFKRGEIKETALRHS